MHFYINGSTNSDKFKAHLDPMFYVRTQQYVNSTAHCSPCDMYLCEMTLCGNVKLYQSVFFFKFVKDVI